MQSTDFEMRAPLFATRRYARRGRALLGAVVLVVSAALSQGALAQDAEQPLSAFLPASTVFAVYAKSNQVAAEVAANIVGELDLAEAQRTLEKLGKLGGEATEEFMSMLGVYDNPTDALAELSDTCPVLAETLQGVDLDDQNWRFTLGVSASNYNPIPALLLALRLDDAELGTALFDGLTACFDSGVAMSEGGVPMYVLGDGGDFPLIVAKVDDTVLVASDPEITRAMVRLANGSDEPSLLDGRLGRLSQGVTGRGFGLSVDFVGLADVLEPLLPMLGGGDAEVRPLQRLLATFRVLNGLAVGASFDEGGLLLESLLSVDPLAAERLGEQDLLALLNCEGCAGAQAELIPSGAASISRFSFSLTALADWLDGWLSDIGPVVGEDLSLESLVVDKFGVDLGTLGLDWLGDTWHYAQLDVFDTDLGGWLQGPGLISTVPVSSESAARAGIAAWFEALERMPEVMTELFEEEELDADAAEQLAVLSSLSVRPDAYRGVEYQRVRAPFAGDYGVAVLAGQLVVTQPAATMRAVIDVFHGAPAIDADIVFGPLIASQPAAPASYELVDVPRFLRGVAGITDLAAGPVASGALFASYAALTALDDEFGEAPDLSQLPTFDDYVGLADLATELLEVLARRTGVAIGSSEIIDGAHWSTMRLPLR